MRTHRLLPFLLALAAGCGKGVSSFADAADQGAAAMNDYANILESIKDKSTAEAAKPRLEAVAKRMGEIVAAMKDLSPSAAAGLDKTGEKVRTAMKGVSTQVTAYMERSRSNREIAAAIGESFGAVSKQLMPLRAMLDV